MKTIFITSIAILFGLQSNIFAQTEIPFSDVIDWNTQITHSSGEVVSGTIAYTNGLITFAGDVQVSGNPNGIAHIKSFNVSDGTEHLDLQIPGINNHNVKPIKIISAGIGTRILLHTIDGPLAPYGGETVTDKGRMYSFNPMNNWFMNDYIFPLEELIPIDFCSVNNTDIIIGNTTCGGHSIFVMKAYPGYGEPLWFQCGNTTPDVPTYEYANTVYLDVNTGDILIGIDSYDIETATHHGRIAQIQNSDGAILWSFDTGYHRIGRILKQSGVMGQLVVIGDKKNGLQVSPVIAEFSGGSILWEKVIPLYGTSKVMDAITTNDEGYLIVGKQNDNGFIVKLDQNHEMEWVSYSPMPVIDVVSVGDGQYSFLLKDTTSIWVVKTKDLSGFVGDIEHTEISFLRIGQDKGSILIWGDFTQAKLMDISGKTLQVIETSFPNVSEFLKMETTGTYIVEILTKEKQINQRMVISN